MSRSESAAELSMEDILASIRSLVPADQRGDGAEPQAPVVPPVPPTLDRVGDLNGAPPTLPLGSLSPRAAHPFEDDLADLLDDPAEPAPLTAKLPFPSPAQFDAPKLTSEPERAPLVPPRPLPDFDALFARSTPREAEVPVASPVTVPEPQAGVTPSEAVEPMAAPVAAEDEAQDLPAAEIAAPSSTLPSSPVPPLMGLGQNGGFFPPPFGKRPAAPAASAGEAKARDAAPAETQTNGAPAGFSVSPLKRSFFPASYQAQSQPPTAVPAVEEAKADPQVDAAAAVAPEPAFVAPEPAAKSEGPLAEERAAYSDALDQALKRLQGMGSLAPDAAHAANHAAKSEPQKPLDASALNPRLFGAVPPQTPAPEIAPLQAVVPKAEAAPAPEAPPLAPAATLGTDAAPEPLQQTAIDPVVLGDGKGADEKSQGVPTPTVRLSDALWSKSAPSMTADAPAQPAASKAAIPNSVELLDVPSASPVVKAFGALALGLAGGGAQGASQAPSQPLIAAPEAPPVPLVVSETVLPPERPAPLDVKSEPVVVAAHPAPQPVASSQRSLEDVVADMLRPMLKQWLEDNMPRIMEKALRAESISAKRD